MCEAEAGEGVGPVIVTNNVRDFKDGHMVFLNVRAMTPGAFIKEWEKDR